MGNDDNDNFIKEREIELRRKIAEMMRAKDLQQVVLA
jgi:hypothetical protein